MINLKKSLLSLGGWYKYLCLMALLFCVCTQTPDNCSDGNRVDYKTEFCYDGLAYPKCAGNKYEPPTQDCINDKVEEKCINDKYAKSGEPCEPKVSAFTVRFDTDGGTPETISPVTVDSGKTMGSKFPEDPKKTGLIFDGWFHNDKKYDSSTVITENVTIKAKFKLKQFTVQFDTDGGTPETISSVTVDTGKTMGEKLPSNPAKMGFTFDGWFNEDNKYDSSTVITKDVTLKARYQVKRFTVQFNTDGGSPSTISSVVVDTGKTLGDNFPSAPTKTGFSFDGWYYADGASYYTSSTPITQNVTLRAQWREGGTSTTKYTLTTSSDPSDGGTVNPASGQTYESGYEVTVTAAPNAGYNFVGWSGASDSKDIEVKIIMNENKELTAKFELKKYIVTFDTDGGSPETISSVTVDTGKTMGEKFPSNPTKTGYTFDGWYDGDDNKYDASTVITKNVTIKAKYQVKKFTVTFDINGGTSAAIEPVTVDTGKTIGTEKFPSNPTRANHTFDGWFDGDDEYNASKPITKNITLKAKWTEDIINAITPDITEQPESGTIIVGGSHKMFVNVSVTDGGTLSYQWYSNTSAENIGGTPITGVTDSVYNVPASEVGTFHYYVIITNTNNSVNGNKTAAVRSAAATVTVDPIPLVHAEKPTITNQPPVGRSTPLSEIDTIRVRASVPSDGGTLSYQWFRNNTASNSGGTAIGGATDNNYIYPTNTTGIYYYYAVVTNTNNSVNGNTTTATVSDAATVTVTVPTGRHFNPDPNIGYSYFIDNRDGKNQTYLTVKIGGQTWMAENLNYIGSGDIGQCHNDNPDNCAKYGRVYTWSEAMNGAASSNTSPSGVQGICPVGWHLPSRQEWNDLIKSFDTGKKLKSQTGWDNSDDGGIGNGSDEFGFSALPGGRRLPDGRFAGLGSFGSWWSATSYMSTHAYSKVMESNNEYVDDSIFIAFYGFSIRCVKDEQP